MSTFFAKDQTSLTSNPFLVVGSTQRYCLAITGAGPVSLETLQDDGVWRTFPSLTFSDSQINIIELPNGQWRVAIKGGPTTVQLS